MRLSRYLAGLSVLFLATRLAGGAPESGEKGENGQNRTTFTVETLSTHFPDAQTVADIQKQLQDILEVRKAVQEKHDQQISQIHEIAERNRLEAQRQTWPAMALPIQGVGADLVPHPGPVKKTDKVHSRSDSSASQESAGDKKKTNGW